MGHGDEQSQLLPKKIEAFAGQRVACRAVSAGACDGLAITANGAVFTWGEGECGCLGHGEELSNQLLPIRWSRRGRWVLTAGLVGTVPGASYTATHAA